MLGFASRLPHHAPATPSAPQAAGSPVNPFVASPTSTSAQLLQNVVADLQGLLEAIPAEERETWERVILLMPPAPPIGIAHADSLDCRRNIVPTTVRSSAAARCRPQSLQGLLHPACRH